MGGPFRGKPFTQPGHLWSASSMANFENQHCLQHLWALLAPFFVRHADGMRPSMVSISLSHMQHLTLSGGPPLANEVPLANEDLLANEDFLANEDLLANEDFLANEVPLANEDLLARRFLVECLFLDLFIIFFLDLFIIYYTL